ncbi:hypothetical protein ML462_03410 [Gramella lutea]|uniref:Uncharacterized protein n=1 Tax=Christiangramia lutea TaxID=1607951 RepID=A0A9X1V1C4_9FLAO|nr:hypothetical protein [Christiangramia lutea]MCH4822211.1 hypothetical protein [Christiangramia lutea]
MDKRAILIILICSFYFSYSYSQEYNKDFSQRPISELFSEQEIMTISLRYSNKDIKKETNDSTFISTYLKYKTGSPAWDSLEVRLRKRGQFRLKNCYYAPLKLKIKKKKSLETTFQGHKNLKLVLPCLAQRDMNDNVMKEYLAYKLYEIISPYHFKTRLVEINYEEDRGKKIKPHELKGFLVEDDKHVAERIGGKVIQTFIHPLNHAPKESVRNAFFQFMIGNTDYSTAYLHNCELILREGEIIPVPYDFDMAGMVNTSYATVSQINDEKLIIEDVTQRMYRGFKRNPNLLREVRLEFIENKTAILDEIEAHKEYFENNGEYDSVYDYIEGFFEILTNEKRFQSEILDMVRTN